MKQKVSIVIPCRNEFNYIGQCIDSLVSNDYQNKEILVVDGISDDGTRDILKAYHEKYDFIKVIDNPDKFTPKAMNLGIQHSTGYYIMIAGAHSSYPSNYISKLVESLQSIPEAVGVGGVMKTKTDGSNLSNSIAKVLSDKYGVGNSTFRIGASEPVEVDTLPFGLYYKDVFEKAGFYNEKLFRNQDIEWSKRVVKYAGRLFLIPEVHCVYYLRGNYKYLSKSNYKNGLWNILTVYITKNLASLSIRHFIPLVFVLSVIVPLVFALIWDIRFALLSILVFLVYVIFIFFRSMKIKDKWQNIFRIFLSYPVLHFSYGIGSFIGLFHIRKLFK